MDLSWIDREMANEIQNVTFTSINNNNNNSDNNNNKHDSRGGGQNAQILTDLELDREFDRVLNETVLMPSSFILPASTTVDKTTTTSNTPSNPKRDTRSSGGGRKAVDLDSTAKRAIPMPSTVAAVSADHLNDSVITTDNYQSFIANNAASPSTAAAVGSSVRVGAVVGDDDANGDANDDANGDANGDDDEMCECEKSLRDDDFDVDDSPSHRPLNVDTSFLQFSHGSPSIQPVDILTTVRHDVGVGSKSATPPPPIFQNASQSVRTIHHNSVTHNNGGGGGGADYHSVAHDTHAPAPVGNDGRDDHRELISELQAQIDQLKLERALERDRLNAQELLKFDDEARLSMNSAFRFSKNVGTSPVHRPSAQTAAGTAAAPPPFDGGIASGYYAGGSVGGRGGDVVEKIRLQNSVASMESRLAVLERRIEYANFVARIAEEERDRALERNRELDRELGSEKSRSRHLEQQLVREGRPLFPGYSGSTARVSVATSPARHHVPQSPVGRSPPPRRPGFEYPAHGGSSIAATEYPEYPRSVFDQVPVDGGSVGRAGYDYPPAQQPPPNRTTSDPYEDDTAGYRRTPVTNYSRFDGDENEYRGPAVQNDGVANTSRPIDKELLKRELKAKILSSRGRGKMKQPRRHSPTKTMAARAQPQSPRRNAAVNRRKSITGSAPLGQSLNQHIVDNNEGFDGFNGVEDARYVDIQTEGTLPFITGKAAPSFNLPANIQKVRAILKNHILSSRFRSKSADPTRGNTRSKSRESHRGTGVGNDGQVTLRHLELDYNELNRLYDSTLTRYKKTPQTVAYQVEREQLANELRYLIKDMEKKMSEITKLRHLLTRTQNLNNATIDSYGVNAPYHHDMDEYLNRDGAGSPNKAFSNLCALKGAQKMQERLRMEENMAYAMAYGGRS